MAMSRVLFGATAHRNSGVAGGWGGWLGGGDEEGGGAGREGWRRERSHIVRGVHRGRNREHRNPLISLVQKQKCAYVSRSKNPNTHTKTHTHTNTHKHKQIGFKLPACFEAKKTKATQRSNTTARRRISKRQKEKKKKLLSERKQNERMKNGHIN